ncbi:hypothetical protein V5799_023213 [Amblyomma americanum]|uniref:Uncharacterized protein n=1 Tax=Amblyomma americanum TaxID=6943 RepID=A0AAQ4FK86_AMBAM
MQVAAKLYAACTDRGRSATGSKEAVNALFSQWKIEKWPRTDPAQDDSISAWLFAAELSRDLDLATIVQPSVGADPDNMAATVVELSQPRCLCADINQKSEEATGLFKAAVRESVAQLGVSSADGLEDRLLAACTSLAAVCRTRYENDSVNVVRFRELSLGLRAFLTVLLNGRAHEDDHVVLRSAPHLPRQLENTVRSVPPLDALNYFGFLALVRMAPLLPDDLRSLRDLFAESLLGRTVRNSEDNTLLCARLVESVLPGCFAKAAQIWRHSTGQELPTREWLSELESVFLRHLADFPWLNELSSLLIRYRVKRHALTRFGPSASDQQKACAPSDRLSTESAFLLFANVSRRQQALKWQRLQGDGTLLSLHAAGSEFSTVPSFRRSLKIIHVPAALVNASVPSNSSSFVFHLARVAVRFYRALVKLLHEDPYERDVSLSFTDDSRRRLSALMSCFDEEAKSSLTTINASATSEGVMNLRRAFLDRTSALLLATKAFEELLPLQRMWNYDLRLAGLEELTAKQLFFIYFALDNCESADPAFHKPSMTPEYKVNVPLRHINEFAQAFGCNAQDHMVSEGNGPCTLMRTRTGQRPIGRPNLNGRARGRGPNPSMGTRVHPRPPTSDGPSHLRAPDIPLED